MKILRAYIMHIEDVDGDLGPDNIGLKVHSNADCYEAEVPDNLGSHLYHLIAHGLFFDNDWTLDDTVSYFEIVEAY